IAADATGKIEEDVTVDVLDGRAFGTRGEDRRRVIDTARHGLLAALHQRLRLRTGNGRAELYRHFTQYPSTSIPPDRLLIQVDVDLFGLEIFLDAPGAEFSSEARLLVSAPRRFYERRLHMIHPHDAGADRLYHAQGLIDVA